MQFLFLILIASVVLSGSGVGPLFRAPDTPAPTWLVFAAVLILPTLVCVTLEMILAPRSVRRARRGAKGSFLRAHLRLRIEQWLILFVTVYAIFELGWLDAVRAVTGNVPAIDELLTVVPALLGFCALWWAHWPIDRAMREALAIRRLERGLPLHLPPSRGGFVLSQVRVHLLVIGIPALMVLAAIETATFGLDAIAPNSEEWVTVVVSGCAALMAFALAPVGIVLAVGARPMPSGPLHSDLQAMMRNARVRPVGIRIWPTDGSMLNGAVVGIVPQLRTVLLTDALLETLHPQELKAVMAHEIAHLRFRHLGWTLAVLMTLVWFFGVLVEHALSITQDWLVAWDIATPGLAQVLAPTASALVIVLAFLAYGWVSRRFELQADAAAARTLSIESDASQITPTGAGLMCQALETVASFSGIDPTRRGWRHGSIRWRQERLIGLVGLSPNALPIDGRVRTIKRVTALLLALLVINASMQDNDSAKQERSGTNHMTLLHFTKMHGLGNDYVYVDTTGIAIDSPDELACLIADRHRGIGSDGLILVEPLDEHHEAHVRMRMFNADGSEAQMCGNGLRCVAKFAVERGMAPAPHLRVLTGAGVLAVEVETVGERVVGALVDMGRAETTAGSQPLAIPGVAGADSTIGLPIDFAKVGFDAATVDALDAAGVEPVMHAVGMGNPHVVLFCDELAVLDLTQVGPSFESHAFFPERVNTHFVQVFDRQTVSMATWERGSGPTLACATGASAVCVAAALSGRTDDKITCRLPGGELQLAFDPKSAHVVMSGPAVEVFSGVMDLELFEEGFDYE